MHQAFEEILCNLCGSSEVDEVYPSTLPEDLSLALTKRFAPADHASGNDRIVRCKKCGLAFASPRMKREYIWEGYSAANDTKYATQGKDRLATFTRAFVKIEMYVPSKGSLLDVGCAAGFFLKVAKDRGWGVEGIEPNQGLARWGKDHYGVPIRSVDFLTAGLPSDHFDAITFWDVLEHVTDPGAYMRESFRILKKGGYLFINFPDFGSPLARLAGKRWWFLSPVHIYYFTRTTMVAFLKKENFDVVRMERHYQTLALGYLFERFEPYSTLISKFGMNFTTMLGLKNIPIRYYASQALAIARKP